MNDPDPREFEKAAAGAGRGGIIGEIFGLLKSNKKWWLVPVLAVILLFSLLMLLSGSGLAPFIYSLF